MATQAVTTSRNPYLILLSVCSAALILPMSFSGGAVATPAIARALGGSGAELTWITNAFMLTFGSLLMVAGTAADRWGRKRVFVAGTGTFAIVSIALVMAPSVIAIDILRAVQGMCAAAALAGGTAALAQEFEGTARARAFSILGTTFGAGLAFGPLLAGALIEESGWRAVFAITAVVGALALAIALRFMRETRSPDQAPMDWAGAATFTGALTLFTIAVIGAPAAGVASAATLLPLAGAALALILFVVVERRRAHPMLDLSLFRYPRFVGVQLLPVATCYCYVVLLVLLPIRFIGIEGDDEMWAGVRMLALSGPILIAPAVAVRLSRRFSAGMVSAGGLAMAAGGLFWLAHCSSGSASTVVAMFLIGAGAGLPWGLMDGLSIGVVPPDRAGMATGIFSTVRVAGEGIALATVATLLTILIGAALRSTGLSGAQIADAAQRIGGGDMPGARALLPLVDPDRLRHAYADAFAMMTEILATLTLASAVAIFLLLRSVDITAPSSDRH